MTDMRMCVVIDENEMTDEHAELHEEVLKKFTEFRDSYTDGDLRVRTYSLDTPILNFDLPINENNPYQIFFATKGVSEASIEWPLTADEVEEVFRNEILN